VSAPKQTGCSKSTLAQCRHLSAAQRFACKSQKNKEPTSGLKPLT
jgi:hypothetical protein